MTLADQLIQEGRQEGRQEGEAALLQRQLARRFGPLPEWARERLNQILVSHAHTSRVIRELGILDKDGYWLASSLLILKSSVSWQNEFVEIMIIKSPARNL